MQPRDVGTVLAFDCPCFQDKKVMLLFKFSAIIYVEAFTHRELYFTLNISVSCRHCMDLHVHGWEAQVSCLSNDLSFGNLGDEPETHSWTLDNP